MNTLRISGRAVTLSLLALLAIALLRVADTYSVFNATYDEPSHIAGGMEWLDADKYEYEPKHTPMRAVYAVGLRLLGVHHYGEVSVWDEGRHILYAEGEYWRNLTVARVAALPFFALTILLVFLWARRLAGDFAGLLAALIYSTLPLALAHAGVAATDTLLTATLTLALFAWGHWLSTPTMGRALLFGMAVATAMLSKLSTLPFLGVVVAITGGVWLLRADAGNKAVSWKGVTARLGLAARSFALAALACCAVIWTGYRFSVDTISPPHPHPTLDRLVGESGPLHDLAYRIVEMPVPAPELFRGLRQLFQHNEAAQYAYFMGEVSNQGHATYFPVGILIKTPIPFLLLMLGGIVMLSREAWRYRDPFAVLPPLAAAVILLVCMSSRINIGLRHVLPMFPMLAIGAGVAAAALWQSPSWRTSAQRAVARGALIFLLAWQAYAGARVHPDYLAYFNECCAAAPQEWLIDSDLDWGQDLARLSKELRRREVTQLHIAYFGSADIDKHDLPPHLPLDPLQPVSGWIAISELLLVLEPGSQVQPATDRYLWLREYQPVARIGKSIRLYYIPPRDADPA